MGGISAIYVLDIKGRLIISRCYKAIIAANVCDSFYENVILQDPSCVKPIFQHDGCSFCWILRNGIYFIAIASSNYNVVLSLTFLYRFVNLLTSYFKHLNDESIRDNFVVVYELLDETIDNGYPQVTEVNILREFIKNQYHQMTINDVRPPPAITNTISWRSEGIKHKKNEIFLDVIECLDIVVSASGSVLRSEIRGCLKMKSYLSGMPELYLGLNDKVIFDVNSKGDSPIGSSGNNSNIPMKSVEMEDVKFHQCVQLAKFENDRTITFIPPDGEFDLMTYRLNSHIKPLFFADVTIYNRSSSKIDFAVKAISQFRSKSIANNVEIHIPVPSDVNCPVFKPSIGNVKYSPDLDSIVWFIKQFQGEKEYIMYASFGLPSVSDDARDTFSKNPVRVKFEIPYFTVSGISVKHLRITESCGYQALPWVRYITQNGDYQLRMS